MIEIKIIKKVEVGTENENDELVKVINVDEKMVKIDKFNIFIGDLMKKSMKELLREYEEISNERI